MASIRPFLIVSLLCLILLFHPFSTVNAKNAKDLNCRSCHKNIYEKALTSPYQHPIVAEGCNICHKEDKGQPKETNLIRFSITTPVALNEVILHIKNIEKQKRYRLKLVLQDEYGNRSDPIEKEMSYNKAPDLTGKIQPVKALKEVQVKEVKKGPYVKALITWFTDSPSTTAVEYWIKNGKQRPYFNSYNDIYSWEHRIELHRLKHKSRYIYRVKSRDLFGNVLSSEEATIDTSKEISPSETSEGDKNMPPSIKSITLFRLKDQQGLFLWIETNKPAYCDVSLKEAKEEKVNPVHKFRINKYATIDVCLECHSFNVSHPVGMKAKGEHVRTPTDLPTIDDGIITCVSCHYPHGSEMPFLGRIDFKADLCLKCHDDTIYKR